MADQKMTVDEAIEAVMNDVTFLGKNQKNDFQKFNFRGIDDVMNVCGPAMRKHGLKAIPRLLPQYTYRSEKAVKNGVSKVVDIVVEVTWRGPAGDEISSVVAAEAFDSGDKATAKAMSVALRTAYLQTLCLPTNEPDPDSYTYELASTEDRDEFLGRIKAMGPQDMAELRRLQSKAKQLGVHDEWMKRGKELKAQMSAQNNNQGGNQ